MKYAGKITDWNDERGFGFIVPNGGGDKVFMHISRLRPRSRRPLVGDSVIYTVVRDDGGRLQADIVKLAAARQSQDLQLLRVVIGSVALLSVAIAFGMHKLPLIVAVAYFFFSAVSFFLYMKDKRAAQQDRWRTPENTLHLFDLVGGWPGGIIAQRVFHHKTAKLSFQLGFWFSVIMNLVGVWWLVTSGLAEQLSTEAADSQVARQMIEFLQYLLLMLPI